VLHLLLGSAAESTIITPLDECVGDARVEHAYFVGLNPDERRALVRYKDGSLGEVSYDFIIFATGRSYAAPIRPSPHGMTVASRLTELRQLSNDILNASTVTVQGGGLVGVELAAELATRLSKGGRNCGSGSEGDSGCINRARIILRSRSRLLAGLPPRAGEIAARWFERNGVEVVYGEEHAQEKPKKGELVLDCTGRPGVRHVSSFSDSNNQQAVPPPLQPSVNASPVSVTTLPPPVGSSSPPSSSLPLLKEKQGFVSPYNSEGFIVVDEFLRSGACKDGRVFAAGDVVRHVPEVGAALTTAREPFGRRVFSPRLRNAHLAESQAETIARSILKSSPATFSSAPSSSLPPSIPLFALTAYPEQTFGSPLTPGLACVSLGPQEGILVFNNLVLGGVLFSTIAALAKFIIERSKVSEVRREVVGVTFWTFMHVIVNVIHVWYVRMRHVVVVVKNFLHQKVPKWRREKGVVGTAETKTA